MLTFAIAAYSVVGLILGLSFWSFLQQAD